MENRIINIFFLISIICSFCEAQNTIVDLRKITSLPSSIKESSGLSYTNFGQFWTNEDSGNKNEIYRCDSLGNLMQIVTIKNEDNIDWEEIQQDQLGNIYLGDCGNNSNDRNDLRFIKFKKSDIVNDKVQIKEIIKYKYEDQIDFPPSKSAFYYDAEAFLPIGDSIYIFTKDRSDPYIGGTRIYAIPNKAGTYIAKLVAIENTENSSYFLGSITGACVNSSQSKVALLSYKKVFLYSNFGNKPFWNGTKKIFDLTTVSQYEGITFIDDCRLLLTDERSVLGGGNLYMLDLCPITSNTSLSRIDATSLNIYPNPSKNYVTIDYVIPFTSNDVFLRIATTEGKILNVLKLISSTEKMTIDTKSLLGTYFFQLFDAKKGIIKSKKIVITN